MTHGRGHLVTLKVTQHEMTHIVSYLKLSGMFCVAIQSCIVYPYTLVPKVFGWINATCRLVRHLVIEMVAKQNVWIAKQPDC